MKNVCTTRFARACYAMPLLKLLLSTTLLLFINASLSAQCLGVGKDSVHCMDPLATFEDLPQSMWPDTAASCLDTLKTVEALGTDVVHNPNACDQTISDTIYRSYRLTFQGGSMMDVTDTLYVFSINIESDSLLCPSGIDTIECGDPGPNALTDPYKFGPKYLVGGDTITLTPGNSFCKISASMKDETWEDCADTKWIFRTWKLKDSKCGRDTVCIDSIVVIDRIAPQIKFDSSKLDIEDHLVNGALRPFLTDTISTGGHGCTGAGNLPFGIVTDACSDSAEIHVSVSSPTAGFGVIKYAGDERINLAVRDIPPGKHFIVYKVKDACHNVLTDSIVVVVKDLTPAVAVCHDAVNLTLTNVANFTLMKAASMDAESYDNCGTYQILARRTDWATACGMDTSATAAPSDIKEFYDKFAAWVENDPGICKEVFEYGYAEEVPFCCDDMGTPIMVEILVIDHHCNIDKCWGFVNVENKITPTVIEALPNDTISCMAYQQNFKADVEAANIAQLNLHFGSYVFDPADQSTWILQDIDCDGNKAPRTYWDGLLVAACGMNVTQRIEGPELGCGKGAIKRIWESVVDGHSGASTVVVATQKIYIKQCPMTDMIVWPDSIVEREACKVTFGLDGNTTFETDGPDLSALVSDCRELGVGFFDKVFDVVAGSGCTKVLRTWCVLDWCDPIFNNVTDWRHFAGIPGVETFVQKIVLVDNTPPSLSVPAINANNRTVNCTASLSATVAVSDTCGASTRWSVTSLGGTVLAQGIGLTANADALPPDDYILRFTATDACGNEVSEMTSFNVATDASPSVVAYTMLTAPLTPMDLDGDNTPDAGMATIWAKEFNSSSAPPCGASEDNLIFLLRMDDGTMNPIPPANDQTSLTFDCTDRVGDGTIILQFWVKDTVTNTADFTYVFLQLEDNTGICGTTTAPGGLVGLISTEINEQVANVTITAESATGDQTVLSKLDGTFQLDHIAGLDVKVVPEKDTDHRNGISTLDLVRLQKHILGVKLIQSPYQLIAADANADGKINPIDLIQLRRLIIAKDNRLSDNTSWRFVDAAYRFDNPTQAHREVFKSYVMAGEDENDIRFVGVKIGDLDGNVVTSRARNRKSIPLRIRDQQLAAGQNTSITMHIKVSDLEGLQFGLLFDEQLLPISLGSDQFPIAEEHVQLQANQLLMSWNGDAINQDEIELKLVVRATTDVRLSDALGINATAFDSEVIAADNVSALHLDFVEDLAFRVEQNQPNPFVDHTQIHFTQPKSGLVILEVSDISGRVIYTDRAHYPAGAGFFELHRDQLTKGILHYKIVSEYGADSKRMIKMN